MTSPSQFSFLQHAFFKGRGRLSFALLAAAPLIAASPFPAFAEAAPAAATKTAPIIPQITPEPGNCKCQGLPDFVQIVHKVKPAVVSIMARLKESDVEEGPNDAPALGQPGNGMGGFPFPFMPFPFQTMPQPSNRTVEARGSGFLISPDGYIVTNNHVVKGASRVLVKLDDGTTVPAQIVGTDAKTDLALLRIKSAKPLPYVDLGNSDEAQPGQWVVAVGNPFGLGGTVTAGIISAMGRDLHSGAYNDFIQVDAPINQGNSGGPLITLNGKVIGVNSMIMSPNGGGSVGIGFAIPSDTVKAVVDQLRKTGHVVRGSMGVEVQDITPVMAQALHVPLSAPGAPPRGALVASVGANSPASKAGLHPGDVILAVDGHPVNSGHDLAVHVTQLTPGTKGTVEVWRDGKTQTLNFVTGNLNNHVQNQAPSEADAAKTGRIGVALSVLTPRARQELGLDETVQGAVVAEVSSGSTAEHAGLRPGDVIIAVGNQPTSTPKAVVTQVQKALSAHQPPLLRILRDGQQLYVAIAPDSNSVESEEMEDGE